ncbi:MAG: DsbA family oxidoreductase [Pseudomonadota bacterium]|nr:DsbA family oxidoreductase [Pseudomonadota bacterium]
MSELLSLDVDVVSDVMCPWCYIGKRRLERALTLVPNIRADIRWRPFQLDPTIPPGGMSRQEYLDRKFGPERAMQVYKQIELAGEAEGIPFAFDRIQKSPNTLDCHRLIRWAAQDGFQDGVVDRLFELFFIEGADIGNHDVLIETARETGMDSKLVAEMLPTDADKDVVENEIRLAQDMGVQGVPAFVFASRYVVAGAQAPEILADVMKKVAELLQNAEAVDAEAGASEAS